ENVNLALDFIRGRKINLTNIGAEDIVDANRKLILGMIWIIILRFTIEDISEEGLSAMDGLLLWCQRKTAPYDDVRVRDFSYSWQDGLAFCALIHRHRPDLLDYYALDKRDARGNMELAFDVAERCLGIPRLLDVEDVCDAAKPDERSVMTYVAQYFHAFSSLSKAETAGRRLGKFADVVQTVFDMQHDYEDRVARLLAAIRAQQDTWTHTKLESVYAKARAMSDEFNEYKASTKRT
ncbi:alpha-actinin, partial [Coemansia sp. RSA 532]